MSKERKRSWDGELTDDELQDDNGPKKAKTSCEDALDDHALEDELLLDPDHGDHDDLLDSPVDELDLVDANQDDDFSKELEEDENLDNGSLDESNKETGNKKETEPEVKEKDEIEPEVIKNRTNSTTEDPLDSLDYDISDDEEKRGFKNERKNSLTDNKQTNGKTKKQTKTEKENSGKAVRPRGKQIQAAPPVVHHYGAPRGPPPLIRGPPPNFIHNRPPPAVPSFPGKPRGKILVNPKFAKNNVTPQPPPVQPSVISYNRPPPVMSHMGRPPPGFIQSHVTSRFPPGMIPPPGGPIGSNGVNRGHLGPRGVPNVPPPHIPPPRLPPPSH
jgi:hypothetical protein